MGTAKTVREGVESKVSPTELMEKNREELTRQLADLWGKIALEARVNPFEFGANTELTVHQFRAIRLLREQPLHMADLARRLDMRMSAVTAFVDRLEEKGLVERVRDPNDRRAIWCRLTEHGKEEADSLIETNREWRASVTSRLDLEEIDRLVKALEVLAEAAEDSLSKDPPVARR